jgi:hydroxymethylpyrimidine/phosphomethylpyrimidine kinase
MESNGITNASTNCSVRPTVLAIGGLDPSGGAGLLVDTAAVRSVGAHGAVVVAVATIQTGRAFVSATPSPASAVSAAVSHVLASHEVRAVKIGALGDAAVVAAVSALAARPGFPPTVVDPVLASTSGGALVDAAGYAALRDRLLPLAEIVTPNMAEAAALSASPVTGVDEMLRAAARILELGCKAVLVKGGHLDGAQVADVFADRMGRRCVFREARIDVAEVRGTGCALAAMIAGYLALGRDLEAAVALARAALRRAISAAYAVGGGPRVLGFGGSASPGLDQWGEERES